MSASTSGDRHVIESIAFLVNNLNVGGLERVVLSLLGELDVARYLVHLICLDGEGALFPAVPLPADRVLVMHKSPLRAGPFAADLPTLWKLRNWIVAKRIRLLHVHNLAPLVYGGLAARAAWTPSRARPKVVYSEHNQVYSASERTLGRFRRYVHLADSVVAVSDDLRRTLAGPRVRVRGPIDVVYNGIDGARFSATHDDSPRRELGVREGEVLVGTGVVLSQQKGISVLIKAAALLASRLPHVRFVVAGDGPLRAELERELAATGLGERFRFLGYRSDMHRVIGALDVYVLPSLWEGLPLALLEALAMNKLIVCTSVGGNPEIVKDGENGLVVPPGDADALAAALERAITDRALRERAAVANRARFERQFSLRSMVAAHEQLYDRILSGGAR
jgi:glycosyltransferase involved in cell wall biosynthesis